MFSLHHFFNSFKYAQKGLFYVFKTEQNFRIQLLIAGGIFILGWFLNFSFLELVLVVVASSLVLGAEVINTVIEKILDIFYPAENEAVKVIKDVSAGIVLIFSFAAFIAGILLFLPHVIK